jgi:hypothetical protein
MAWIARIAAPDLAYWDLVAPEIVSGSGIAMASPAARSSAMTSRRAAVHRQGRGHVQHPAPDGGGQGSPSKEWEQTDREPRARQISGEGHA